MGILSFLSPIQSNLTALLGGALLLSLAGNGGLLWYGTHEAKVATSYVVTTKAVNQAATIHKDITENRDAKAVQSSQAVTTTGIAADIASLRSQSRIVNLRPASTATPGINSTGTGTVLSTSSDQSPSVTALTQIEETDREICVTNTDLVKGWQDYYQTLLTIQKEESLGTTSSTSH